MRREIRKVQEEIKVEKKTMDALFERTDLLFHPPTPLKSDKKDDQSKLKRKFSFWRSTSKPGSLSLNVKDTEAEKEKMEKEKLEEELVSPRSRANTGSRLLKRMTMKPQRRETSAADQRGPGQGSYWCTGQTSGLNSQY